MKKISFISLIAVMALPAVAAVNVQELYGKEPVDPKIVAQYEQQFGKTEDKVLPEQNDEKNAEDVKKTEETAKNEDVKKEIKEEPKEISENTDYKKSEYEQPSNPKARFPHGLQFGVGISPTTGLNGFVGYNNKNFDSFWAKRFGIRFDFASYSPIRTRLNRKINETVEEEGGIEFDDTLKIDNIMLDAKHYGAMIDFYPFGNTWFLGGLRVSGGYFAGKLDLDADIHGTPDGGKMEFELNNNKYYYTDAMQAKVMADWKFSGPYLGTGFDLGLFWGFKMYFDAGVVFTGNTAKFDLAVPTTNLYYGNGTPVAGNETQFNTDRDKELSDAREEIKDYPYYPLVKLGFMYRF